MKWNTTSLKSNELVESNGKEQVVYQERKTHSSVSMVADVLYRRTYEKWENFIICWGKPEVHNKKPPRSGFRRCEIVFIGFQVTKATNDTCQIALTSAFHELGNVPSLVIQDELKKISLRVSKIIARVQEIRRLAARTTVSTVDRLENMSLNNNNDVVRTGIVSGSVVEFTCCGVLNKGQFCSSCGKKNQPKPSGPSCNSCGSPHTGSRFCGTCGNIIIL